MEQLWSKFSSAEFGAKKSLYFERSLYFSDLRETWRTQELAYKISDFIN